MKVSRRARRYQDASGDPLDGLVNMFDVGIVLAVGFLLAALASKGLTGALTSPTTPTSQVTVSPGEVLATVPPNATPTAGQGSEVGRVYRLPNGQLVYVVPSSVAPSGPAATPTPSGTP